ncbi:NUDIX domain-containing protein [Nonomuraea sp. SMC257]|uniref:NUDIX domain-containing protein n=1 Tax=Nonomuraea montanisoli TaxID=2741721 RepID=A0A7Y6IDP0_9ACTN|nr:NUDIX domain-containing protein [Nonomuraea montanisoli]NUW36343.1 NUDIX domain-containing protein [Nonomuraea montanisoli]
MKLVARLWRSLGGRLQWRLLWLKHATFMVGVTGIVRDDEGRLLLLNHRLWPEGRSWGFPTGYANRSETFEDTVVREVREETGLTVRVGRLVRLVSGYRLRAEVAYEAVLVGGDLKVDPFEVLEAGWFSPDELPEGMQRSHRELLELSRRGATGPAGHGRCSACPEQPCTMTSASPP